VANLVFTDFVVRVQAEPPRSKCLDRATLSAGRSAPPSYGAVSGAELERVEADAGNPLADQPVGQTTRRISTSEQELARLPGG
jgi:hypothetical protein